MARRSKISYLGTSTQPQPRQALLRLWEYRMPVMTGPALAREVEAALRDATLDADISGFDRIWLGCVGCAKGAGPGW